MLSKAEFIKAYKQLTATDKAKVKQYHEDKYKGAIFWDTLETAEKCLTWIKETEENN